MRLPDRHEERDHDGSRGGDSRGSAAPRRSPRKGIVSLLVVGSVALDSIETAAGARERVLGGAASYFSVAASFLTRSVRLVGVVGQDFPPAHVAFLRERGVDLMGLEQAAGPSFHWRGRYSADFARRETLETKLNVFEQFQPKLPDAYRDAELVFLANIHPALQLDVLEQVRHPRLVACDTMNFWIERNPEELRRTLGRVGLLVINDEEARQLAGEHNLVRAARAIRAMGPHSVIVKRGDSGALLFHEHGTFAAPAYPLEEVVDPTGAGDSFAGGFMGYLAEAGSIHPQDVRRAMIYGSVLASFCVEDFSLDRFRRITAADVHARFRAFKALTHFEDIDIGAA
jgi:sugar/nucleoside kinase (ribokinase family)